ncbi:MAG: VWA domain-containing protein [Verrucomicrobiota bacterium]
MSLTFINAVLVPLIGLAAVPLLIHLFARTRPPVYRFSSVEFIARILRKTMRVKRPQDILLLILRTLIFGAVIFLFLRPVFFSSQRLAGGNVRRNVVLIVDTSASMGCVEGAQTRLASACAEASGILSDLSARDTANIIWMASSARAAFPEMAVNFGYLKDELRKATATYEAGNSEKALDLAVEMLDGKGGKNEICVISDFQRSDWENAALSVPPGIELVNVRVGREEAANTALTSIETEPVNPLRDEEVTIYCEVKNFSDSPEHKKVFLTAGETRKSQSVVVPPFGKSVAAFKHVFSEEGTMPFSASIEEDDFPGDDHRLKSVYVRDKLRAAIQKDSGSTAEMWRKAVRSMGWITEEGISADSIGAGSEFDVLMLGAWKGGNPGSVRKLVQSGVTVFWMPSPEAGRAGFDFVSSFGGSNEGGTFRWEELSGPMGVRVAERDADVFGIFAGGQFGDPAAGEFSARFNCSRADFPVGRVLLEYEDGVPALVELKDMGTAYFWNLPLGEGKSDWQNHAEYVILLGEMILQSRATMPAGSIDIEYVPGQMAAFGVDQQIPARDVSLVDRNGRAVEFEAQVQGAGAHFISSPIKSPGLYTWKHKDAELGYSLFNFPVVESDLRSMSPQQVEQMGTITVEGGKKIHALRTGIKLWPYLLFAALAGAMLEAGFLYWCEKT